ncbi:MAG: tetratricopeptide repeat protein [Leptolyngbya sp.]|nr:tetratricopeptide repeat protein [Leptolyngbya sp.]
MTQPYQPLIDQLVTDTLKGKIQSKQQVYRRLQQELEPGCGELFERALTQAQAQVDQGLAATDEFKQAKAQRQQRALRMIEAEWQRWQRETQATAALGEIVATLTREPAAERLPRILAALDANRAQPLDGDQLRQLAQALRQATDSEDASGPTLADLAQGLDQGMATWQGLQTEVVGWIFASGQSVLGFGHGREPQGPWHFWSQHATLPSLRYLFEDLALHQSVTAAGLSAPLLTADWVAWVVVLQRLQRALVTWFDQQPYDPKAGKRLSIATFLSFAVLWSHIANRLGQLGQTTLSQGSFQVVIQGLRQFANQPYFPLYGGLFTALAGEPLQTLLDYLDQPLQQVPNTATKGRILTLLGYSQRAMGNHAQAAAFHQQALAIAREAQDSLCEIASLNHLSRTAVAQQDYETALSYSQRALILARQQGDTLGQANALANLGYSQVAQGQGQLLEPEAYEAVIGYLEQGVKLSAQVGDRPSQALCANSLGIAHLKIGQPERAITTLTEGLQVAQAIGDRFLVASNLTHLAVAYQTAGNWEQAILRGSLGMYLFNQMGSEDWRPAAALLSILYGQLGPEVFQATLQTQRSPIIATIGVDGYDYLLPLLLRYREGLTDP